VDADNQAVDSVVFLGVFVYRRAAGGGEIGQRRLRLAVKREGVTEIMISFFTLPREGRSDSDREGIGGDFGRR
jgi:hypothetical protein